MIGVEDLGLSAVPQHHLQSIQTKLRGKAIEELPAEYVSGEEIDDRHQVQEAFL
jgi:hypothetical protein